jgi:transcriptional regulator of acetoin/glycerol metabolism
MTKMIRLTNRDGSLRPLDIIIDDAIQLAIEHCSGNKTHAAKGLSLPRSTFYRKLKEGA